MNFGRKSKTLAGLLLVMVIPAGEAATGPRAKDAAAPQEVVLTGGRIVLEFDGNQNVFLNTDLNRLDQLTWSGGTGALTGENLLDEVIDNPGSTEPEDIFGESFAVYGDPQSVAPGYAATASNQTAITLTTTTTGTRYGVADNEPIASTDYTVFPAGGPDENEFRVSRTINFSTATPVYPSSAVRVYMPDLKSLYGIVLYPNAAGNIVSQIYDRCTSDCIVTDWNGKWFAEDDDSGTGMVVFRDTASQAPAELVVAYEEESLDNQTSIAVLQPAGGFQAPLTEIEWVCFYDRSTWTAADQQAGNLPQGCAQEIHSVTPVTPAPAVTIALDLPSVSAGQAAQLTWSSTNSTACIASGTWSGSEPTSGTVTETPNAAGTFTYALSCTGPGGIGNASVSLTAVAAAAAVLAGHVGGGGALDWQWLVALTTLTLMVRGSKAHWRKDTAPRKLAALLMLCVALASVTPAQAQEVAESPQPYVGLRAGQANYQYSSADLENALGNSSDIQAMTISRRQFGGMLYGGVPLYRSLMLEVSYVQLGQFPLSIRTTSADTVALANRILGQLAPAGHGLTAGFALPMQFGSVFGVEPRVSALYYQSRQLVATSSGDYRNDLRGVGIDAGLSLTAHIAGPLQLGVGADCMHMTQACNVMLYTGQIEYRFGRGR